MHIMFVVHGGVHLVLWQLNVHRTKAISTLLFCVPFVQAMQYTWSANTNGSQGYCDGATIDVPKNVFLAQRFCCGAPKSNALGSDELHQVRTRDSPPNKEKMGKDWANLTLLRRRAGHVLGWNEKSQKEITEVKDQTRVLQRRNIILYLVFNSGGHFSTLLLQVLLSSLVIKLRVFKPPCLIRESLSIEWSVVGQALIVADLSCLP
jgi:hypothetical protein